MRVTQSMIANNAINNIRNSLLRREELSEEISTGKKINKPSDDPVNAGKSSYLMSRNRLLNGYIEDIKNTRSVLVYYDTALQEMQNVNHRIKELAVQAANDTQTVEDRHHIALELKQLKEHLYKLANTQIGGKYIFGGAKTNVPPVRKENETVVINTPQEANIRAKLPVEHIDIEYGVTVYDVFKTDSGETVFGILDRLIDSAESGNDDDIERDLGSLDSVLNKVNANLARVGSVDNMLESMEKRFEKVVDNNTDIINNLVGQTCQKR
ncbi:flagellar hook-associated protein FlgL [Marinitoga lauensis]|uniref:flagellar hook-associated protein FlgL n=1 Tax=Marinitoga lauensis TaxID=2201189 RepID=UPI00101154E7|nr:flagellar hook-associated protein FlgL [Marinitoga lauensis]